MAHSIDANKLESVMSAIRKSPSGEQALVDFLTLLKPIITLTMDRFPSNMSDDLSQEIKVFLMKRAAYLANAYFAGRIKNPTSYFFRVCYNAGINYYKKEAKTVDHLLPIDDLKLDPVYKPRSSRKDKIVQQIREETQAFINMHFRNREQRQIAERFMIALMNGQRPSFNTEKVEKFAKSSRRPAKDTYSIVLIKIRELVSEHIEELLS